MVITRNYSKAKTSVDVRDFGARGDDSFDDRAAIQAAIDSVSGTGGIVFIPKGTYRISDPGLVVIANDVRLVGDGMGLATLRQSGALTTLISLAPAKLGDAPGTVELQHLSLTTDPDADPVKNLVHVKASADNFISYATFTQVEFDLPGEACLLVDGEGALGIEGCVLSRAVPAKHIIAHKPALAGDVRHLYLGLNVFRGEDFAIFGQDNTIGGGSGLGTVVTHDAGAAASTPPASPGTPTALIGLTAIPGTSPDYMRADAAPAIDQAIGPTWTNAHVFSWTVGIATAGDGNASLSLAKIDPIFGVPLRFDLSPLPSLTPLPIPGSVETDGTDLYWTGTSQARTKFTNEAKVISASTAIDYDLDGNIVDPPTNGQIRFNHATFSQATRVRVSKTTASFFSGSRPLLNLPAGAILYVQAWDNAASYAEFNVTAPPTEFSFYVEYTVTPLRAGTALSVGKVGIVFDVSADTVAVIRAEDRVVPPISSLPSDVVSRLASMSAAELALILISMGILKTTDL